MSTISQIKIHFLGAAGTVTGSKYLIETTDKTLLFDCGLFQGLKELRALNWNKFPVDPATIDVVLLTHGHLDHTGYLPRMVQQGFVGKILGTIPTLQVTKIILEDSARIQEEDAELANAEGFSKHHPAVPLYDSMDVKNTLPLFQPQLPDVWINISKEIQCRFRYNGHIIGATFIELKIGSKVIVFSGDIGREKDALMYPTQKPEHADIVLIESTYGNRMHSENAEESLAALINRNNSKQGTIIIPSFAVERTQTLMYLLHQFKKKKIISDIPIYMDSPMGETVLDVFRDNPSWHKLSKNEMDEMCKDVKLIKTIRETYDLSKSGKPKIIIAGSGMASGGRVLTYFVQYLGDPSATVLLVGYQAEGTRGRALLEGAKEIKLFGKYFPVRAEVKNIEGLSSHADQQGLISWLSKLDSDPENIFIVHGEPDAALALKDQINKVYNWDAIILELNQSVIIQTINVSEHLSQKVN